MLLPLLGKPCPLDSTPFHLPKEILLIFQSLTKWHFLHEALPDPAKMKHLFPSLTWTLFIWYIGMAKKFVQVFPYDGMMETWINFLANLIFSSSYTQSRVLVDTHQISPQNKPKMSHT